MFDYYEYDIDLHTFNIYLREIIDVSCLDSALNAKDEINIPIALSAFRDKKALNIFVTCNIYGVFVSDTV